MVRPHPQGEIAPHKFLLEEHPEKKEAEKSLPRDRFLRHPGINRSQADRKQLDIVGLHLLGIRSYLMPFFGWRAM